MAAVAVSHAIALSCIVRIGRRSGETFLESAGEACKYRLLSSVAGIVAIARSESFAGGSGGVITAT